MIIHEMSFEAYHRIEDKLVRKTSVLEPRKKGLSEENRMKRSATKLVLFFFTRDQEQSRRTVEYDSESFLLNVIIGAESL